MCISKKGAFWWCVEQIFHLGLMHFFILELCTLFERNFSSFSNFGISCNSSQLTVLEYFGETLHRHKKESFKKVQWINGYSFEKDQTMRRKISHPKLSSLCMHRIFPFISNPISSVVHYCLVELQSVVRREKNFYINGVPSQASQFFWTKWNIQHSLKAFGECFLSTSFKRCESLFVLINWHFMLRGLLWVNVLQKPHEYLSSDMNVLSFHWISFYQYFIKERQCTNDYYFN
jgi:hypothetical protein